MLNDLETRIRMECLTESRELLEETEEYLFDLELDPTESRTIDTLFRLIHTLKGSGLAAGFDDLADVAHQFEILLEKLRSKELPPDSRVIDIALKFTDLIHDILQKLGRDFNARVDTNPPKQWLAGLETGMRLRTVQRMAHNDFFAMGEEKF